MKLSRKVLLGLKRLGNPTLIPEENFQLLLRTACATLLNQSQRSEICLNKIGASKPDILKEGLASLLILLVEGSRHNLDTNTLLSTLEHYNLNVTRLERIADLYKKHRASFQVSLRNIGTPHPKVIDVKWRLDFCIKSSSLEHEGRELYLIQIVTEQVSTQNLTGDTPKLNKICFTCSFQQLQELVAKLKDVTRLVHAIAYPK